MQPGVVGKDVIIALCGAFGSDQVLNHAIEFVGDGLQYVLLCNGAMVFVAMAMYGVCCGTLASSVFHLIPYVGLSSSLPQRARAPNFPFAALA